MAGIPRFEHHVSLSAADLSNDDPGRLQSHRSSKAFQHRDSAHGAKIDAILDEQGNVIDMKVVSGHPLLYQAALDALDKWKYDPTYLNDRPIAVELVVTITFQWSQ